MLNNAEYPQAEISLDKKSVFFIINFSYQLFYAVFVKTQKAEIWYLVFREKGQRWIFHDSIIFR